MHKHERIGLSRYQTGKVIECMQVASWEIHSILTEFSKGYLLETRGFFMLGAMNHRWVYRGGYLWGDTRTLEHEPYVAGDVLSITWKLKTPFSPCAAQVGCISSYLNF